MLSSWGINALGRKYIKHLQSPVGSHQSTVAVDRSQSTVAVDVTVGRSRSSVRRSRGQWTVPQLSARLPKPLDTSAERRAPSAGAETPSAGTRSPGAPAGAGEPTTILPCPPARRAPLPSPRTAPALAASTTPTRRDSLPAPWTMGIGRDCRDASAKPPSSGPASHAAIVRRWAALVDQRYRSRPLPSRHPPRRALPHRRAARDAAGWARSIAPTT